MKPGQAMSPKLGVFSDSGVKYTQCLLMVCWEIFSGFGLVNPHSTQLETKLANDQFRILNPRFPVLQVSGGICSKKQ